MNGSDNNVVLTTLLMMMIIIIVMMIGNSIAGKIFYNVGNKIIIMIITNGLIL